MTAPPLVLRTVKNVTFPSSAADPRHPARRWLNLAAVVAAALASMATSKAPEPHVAPQAVAAASPNACALLALDVCETSPAQTLLVVKATGVAAGACTVDVAQARAAGADGSSLGQLDRLPAPVTVHQDETVTFSLQFPGSAPTDHAVVRLDVRTGIEGVPPEPSSPVLSHACAVR